MTRRHVVPLGVLGVLAACNQLLGNENGRSESADLGAVADASADERALPSPPPAGPVLGTQRLVSLTFANALDPRIDLDRAFDPELVTYRVLVPWSPRGVRFTLTATTRDAGDVLTLYSQRSPALKLTSGVASAPIVIDPDLGDTLLLDVSNGQARSTYELTVIAPPTHAVVLHGLGAPGAMLGVEAHSMSIDPNGNTIVAGYRDDIAKPQGSGVLFRRRDGEWSAPIALPTPTTPARKPVHSMIAFDGTTVALGTPSASAVDLFTSDATSTPLPNTVDGAGRALARGGDRLAVSVDQVITSDFNAPKLQVYRASETETPPWRFQTSPPNPPGITPILNTLALDPTGNVLAVGMPYEGSGLSSNVGAAYAIRLDQAGPQWIELASDTKQGNSYWGFGVAANKSFVAVGEFGRVRLFETSNFTLSRTFGDTIPGAWGFGRAVALCDDMLVVGAPAAAREDGTVPYSGAVYVFEHDGAEWPLRRILRSPSPEQQRGFGCTVACTARTVVVGAPLDSSGYDEFVAGDPSITDNGGALYVLE